MINPKQVEQRFQGIQEKWCNVKKGAINVLGTLMQMIESITGVVDTIVENWAKIKWGMVNLGDIVGSKIANIAYAVASNLVQVLASQISAAVAKILEALFRPLLALLTAGPGALFGLLKSPHKAVNLMLRKERVSLYGARSDLNNIISILKELLDFKSAREYVAIMEDTLPYIQEAISIMKSIINELEPSDITVAPFLDKGKYNRLDRLLQVIINKTDPEQFSELASRINSSLESSRREKYEEDRKVVEEKYKNYKIKLKTWYQSVITDDIPTQNPDSDKVKKLINKLKNKYFDTSKAKSTLYNEIYASALEELDLLKDAELEASKITGIAEHDWEDIKSVAFDYLAEVGNKYIYMVNMIGKYSISFLNNIKEAAFAYQRYHQYCQVMVNMKDKILDIATWFLEKVYDDAAAEEMANAFRNGLSYMESSEEIFVEDIDKYNDPEERLLRIEATTDIAAVNNLTVSTKALLNMFVVESLINLINLKADFGVYEDEYNEFVDKMRTVEDWDRESGWVDNDTKSPYIDMLTNAGDLISSLVRIAFNDDQVYRGFAEFGRTIDRLISHNFEVQRIVADFNPASHPMSDKLEKVIKALGIFDLFMSLNDFAAVIGLIKSFSADLPSISLSFDECDLSDLDDDVKAKGSKIINENMRVQDDSQTIDNQKRNNAKTQEAIVIASGYNMDNIPVL